MSPSTRRINAGAADAISITGLTKGPASGWTWDGQILSHPLGIGMRMCPDAASRITEAIASIVPPRTERLSGLQVSQLPEAERAEFEWDRNMEDGSGGGYIRHIDGTPAVAEFDVDEVAEVIRRKGQA